MEPRITSFGRMVRHGFGRAGLAVAVGALVALPPVSANAQVAQRTAAARTRTHVVENTLEAAAGYPWVHVQLVAGGRALSGDRAAAVANPLLTGGSLGDTYRGDGRATSFTAVLDTGASGHVVSRVTAAGFAIQPDHDAVYHETGQHMEVAMGVSRPYALRLAGSTGHPNEPPTGEFLNVDPAARLLLNTAQPHDETIKPEMGAVNLIGMPAIRKLIVELDPSPMRRPDSLGAGGREQRFDLNDLDKLVELTERFANLSAGPIVRLHHAGRYPRLERDHLIIPLTLRDYNRYKNPQDHGARPTLDSNPVIVGIETELGGRTHKTDWMLDTGAPVSLISTAHARVLGLVDTAGNPLRDADFEITFGGIGGDLTKRPGFVIDRMSVPTESGVTIEYRRPHVVIHDVSIVTDSGEVITLDGVFGTNLLLPTVGGLGDGLAGLPTRSGPGPWDRVLIDASRGRMYVEPASR